MASVACGRPSGGGTANGIGWAGQRAIAPSGPAFGNPRRVSSFLSARPRAHALPHQCPFERVRPLAQKRLQSIGAALAVLPRAPVLQAGTDGRIHLEHAYVALGPQRQRCRSIPVRDWVILAQLAAPRLGRHVLGHEGSASARVPSVAEDRLAQEPATQVVAFRWCPPPPAHGLALHVGQRAECGHVWAFPRGTDLPDAAKSHSPQRSGYARSCRPVRETCLGGSAPLTA